MTLRKAGGNWVDGDQFFDRDAELEALTERVKDGTHTLLTAQRRMGKTSLVRELLRRLKSEGCFETIFVDLEGARTPADAIAEIGVRSKSVQGVQHKLKSWLANTLREAVDRVDTLAVSEVQVKLHAGIDAGNWQQKGDEVFAALADNDRPVVLAISKLNPTRSRSRTFSVYSNMTAIWQDKGTTTGSYRAYSKLGGVPGTPDTSSP